MFRTKTAAAGFSIIIAILFLISAFGLYQLNAMSQHVENIIRHPFAVSNAARGIEYRMIAMDRSMRDVILADSVEERSKAIALVDEHEAVISKKFELIFERFLGDKRKVQDTYRAFVDWQPIRKEIIQLAEQGQLEAAEDLSNGLGAERVTFLYNEVQGFVELSINKANQVHARVEWKRNRAVIILSSAATVAIILAIFISVSVIKSMQAGNRERARQHHLIDQHIMTATLDKDGTITDASNAMCRFLDVAKDTIINKPSHFFDHSEKTEETEDKIRRIIQTGKAWDGEIKRITDNGETKWAHLSIIPNFDDSYELRDFSAILNDVTSNKLSGRDKLTNLYNRRRFDEIVQREIAVARRHDRGVTLAILDIDHFKTFNDTYGHPAGDAALTEVANTIRECLRRPDDFAFRIGGEEFAILVADQDRHHSKVYFDELRNAIAGLEIPHAASSVSDVLTASIGVCVALKAEHDIGEFYSLADEALYRAKENRNEVVLHSFRPKAADTRSA